MAWCTCPWKKKKPGSDPYIQKASGPNKINKNDKAAQAAAVKKAISVAKSNKVNTANKGVGELTWAKSLQSSLNSNESSSSDGSGSGSSSSGNGNEKPKKVNKAVDNASFPSECSEYDDEGICEERNSDSWSGSGTPESVYGTIIETGDNYSYEDFRFATAEPYYRNENEPNKNHKPRKITVRSGGNELAGTGQTTVCETYDQALYAKVTRTCERFFYEKFNPDKPTPNTQHTQTGCHTEEVHTEEETSSSEESDSSSSCESSSESECSDDSRSSSCHCKNQKSPYTGSLPFGEILPRIGDFIKGQISETLKAANAEQERMNKAPKSQNFSRGQQGRGCGMPLSRDEDYAAEVLITLKMKGDKIPGGINNVDNMSSVMARKIGQLMGQTSKQSSRCCGPCSPCGCGTGTGAGANNNNNNCSSCSPYYTQNCGYPYSCSYNCGYNSCCCCGCNGNNDCDDDDNVDYDYDIRDLPPDDCRGQDDVKPTSGLKHRLSINVE